MSLQVPDLDDRSYQDLVEEAIARIPRHAPQWTNHNASDPGITLVELFAYLAEVMIFRLNRVSDLNRAKFLKLLTGETTPRLDHDELEAALRKATLELRKPNRAVTCEDFERIAREGTAEGPPEQQVKRAVCFPRRNLDAPGSEERQRDRPGHTSVVFICGVAADDVQTMEAVRNRLIEFFEPRRLLTSRVHVCPPRFVNIGLRIRVGVLPGSSQAALKAAAHRELNLFVDPLTGGPEGRGWPFGRSLYASDVYRILQTLPGVDYAAVEFRVPDTTRLRRGDLDEVVEVLLQPDELARVRPLEIDFERTGRAASGGSGKW